MELHSPVLVLDYEQHKEMALKNRIKPHRKKEEENNATSSSTGIRCSECSMSFLSTKALFGHLRIHRKSNRGA
ncbi:hypothetical protein IEQ34_005223 [Dendrobium chrysotoxum]|uniref:C2H2-type domain-containing protein n=1 Tax=Dendrobium chrysotoxum TaxID=161865 RepID=A0AAV7GTC1_DENCH|nr:hypothetical protein IEQ34_005223 [Dendrobium chrysotoxum]